MPVDTISEREQKRNADGSIETDQELEVSIVKERNDNGEERKLGLVLSRSPKVLGLLVSKIEGSSQAADSLLREGDRVITVNGVAVQSAGEATDLMNQARR